MPLLAGAAAPDSFIYSRGMSDVTISVRENGPLKVVGPVTIVDSEGVPFIVPPGNAVVLCRCGHSSTKPFCDTTHKKIGFMAVETAPRAR